MLTVQHLTPVPGRVAMGITGTVYARKALKQPTVVGDFLTMETYY